MVATPRFWSLVERAEREAIPLDVSIELTWHCNFRCRHCYIPDYEAPDLLSTRRLLRLLEELAEMGTLFIALTGGEPMARSDWPVIARRARELGFHLMVLSNGSLIDEAAARLLADLDALVEISFHSADPAIFDRVTGVPGSHSRVLRAVHRLKDAGAEVELQVPVSNLNRDGAANVPKLARRLGVSSRVYTKILPAKDGNLAPLELRLSEIEAARIIRGAAAGGRPLHPIAVDDGRPLCAAGARYANITAAGEVMACAVLPGSAGNLNERGFREIWEGSHWLRQLRAIRRADLGECAGCAKIAYCGRCHAVAAAEDGDLLGRSAQACRLAEAIEAELSGRYASESRS